jgi:hypothetical protein
LGYIYCFINHICIKTTLSGYYPNKCSVKEKFNINFLMNKDK